MSYALSLPDLAVPSCEVTALGLSTQGNISVRLSRAVQRMALRPVQMLYYRAKYTLTSYMRPKMEKHVLMLMTQS